MTTGNISTIAGTRECCDEFGQYVVGYSGDGGPSKLARFNYIQGLTVDVYGNILISDSQNQVIRMIEYGTTITSTVAGSGEPGHAGDGLYGTSIKLLIPQGLVAAPNGSIYITEFGNSDIRSMAFRLFPEPSFAPTFTPTFSPSFKPTWNPTSIPSVKPSLPPTGRPSNPTFQPSTNSPSFTPTLAPWTSEVIIQQVSINYPVYIFRIILACHCYEYKLKAFGIIEFIILPFI